jgi:hypothetical protein
MGSYVGPGTFVVLYVPRLSQGRKVCPRGRLLWGCILVGGLFMLSAVKNLLDGGANRVICWVFPPTVNTLWRIRRSFWTLLCLVRFVTFDTLCWPPAERRGMTELLTIETLLYRSCSSVFFPSYNAVA